MERRKVSLVSTSITTSADGEEQYRVVFPTLDHMSFRHLTFPGDRREEAQTFMNIMFDAKSLRPSGIKRERLESKAELDGERAKEILWQMIDVLGEAIEDGCLSLEELEKEADKSLSQEVFGCEDLKCN